VGSRIHQHTHPSTVRAVGHRVRTFRFFREKSFRFLESSGTSSARTRRWYPKSLVWLDRARQALSIATIKRVRSRGTLRDIGARKLQKTEKKIFDILKSFRFFFGRTTGAVDLDFSVFVEYIEGNRMSHSPVPQHARSDRPTGSKLTKKMFRTDFGNSVFVDYLAIGPSATHVFDCFFP